jgi:hypothetical protein
MAKTQLTHVAGVRLPDSALAHQATELLLDHGTEFLYNHSLRVFVYGVLNGERAKVSFDPELLYVSAVFHDLGLTKHYCSKHKRFEVDGADAARSFLQSHGIPAHEAQVVWDAIALHTTIGVAEWKEPEVALLYSGVGLDVMGDGYEHLSAAQRQEVLAAFPRTGFKENILQTFFGGFAHKPETTFGNIKADVAERFIPGYKSPNFCDLVLNSPWSE